MFQVHCFTTTPESLLTYPEHTYRGRKLQVYQAARDKLVARGPRDQDAYLHTFVKYEKIKVKYKVLNGVTVRKRTVARVIQPRRPEYNLRIGVFVHQLEFPIYRILRWISGDFAEVVMKGLNAEEVAANMLVGWERRDQPVAIGIDCVRYDQHVSAAMLSWEHKIYGLFFAGENKSELKRALLLQLKNHGILRDWDGEIRYDTFGTRCSGDMNTAVGNCLAMVCIIISFFLDMGFTESDYSLINNGDDCVVVVEKRNVDVVVAQLPRYYRKLGFLIEMEPPVDIFERIEFCQTHPVWNGKNYIMVRNFPDVLSKDSICLLPEAQMRSVEDKRAYWDALGECGLALCSGIPVMQSFYEMYRRQGMAREGPNVFEGSGMWYLSQGLQSDVREITARSRTSFGLAFDTSPYVQCSLEEYYDKCEFSAITIDDDPIGDSRVIV